MRKILAITAVSLFTLLASIAVHAQDKKVRIAKFEVDGKLVTVSKYKVQIITGDKKVYKAKTDETGFIVPAEVTSKARDTFVGVVISFEKYTLPFFAVHSSNFDVEWLVVGIDTAPFEADNLGNADPADTALIYYVRFAGEPERNLIVRTSKPKTTIQRIH